MSSHENEYQTDSLINDSATPESGTKNLEKAVIQSELHSPILSNFDLSRIMEERVIAHAQETVESLNRQLDLKKDMVAKYRLMLKTTRDDFSEKLQIKDAQIKELQEKIYSNSLKEIERFQSQTLIFDKAPILLLEDKKEEEEIENEMLENLKKMNRLKDENLEANRLDLEKIQADLAALQEKKEKEILDLKNEKDIEIEKLTEKLNESVQENLELRQSCSRFEQELFNERETVLLKDQSHQEIVIKLKGENEAKSKKIKTLKNEIQEWKSKISSFSNELMQLKTIQNDSSSNETFIQDQMALKIGQLEVKNKRFLEEIKAVKIENELLEKEVEMVKIQLSERKEELHVLRKTIELYKEPGSSGKAIEQLISQLLATSLQKPRGNTSRWNLEKKEQKKLEALREKLKENVLKVEELSCYNEQLKERLAKNEKERLKIFNELQTLKSKQSAAKDESLKETHRNEINKLNDKIQALQAALSKSNNHFKTQYNREIANHDHLVQTDKKYDNLQKEYIDLQRKIDEMTLELKKEQESAAIHITKLSDENQKVRYRLKKESEKSESTQKLLHALSLEIDGYKNEISILKGTVRVYSRESISEDKNETIRSLKRELQEKDRTIHEMNATEGSSGKLISENRKLRRELEVMEMRVQKLSHLPKNILSI